MVKDIEEVQWQWKGLWEWAEVSPLHQQPAHSRWTQCISCRLSNCRFLVLTQPFPASLSLLSLVPDFTPRILNPPYKPCFFSPSTVVARRDLGEDSPCSGEPGWLLMTRDRRALESQQKHGFILGSLPQQNTWTLILGFSSLKKTLPFKGSPVGPHQHRSHIKTQRRIKHRKGNISNFQGIHLPNN